MMTKFHNGGTYCALGSVSDFVAEANSRKRHFPDKWAGGTWDNACLRAVHGDMELAEASDALLNKFDVIPAPTARHEIIDGVVGAFPNVPAYIAGQPLSMRRKVKRENEFQPIAIVVNLGATMTVAASDMQKRGIAVVALVRAIVTRRPVELWAGVASYNRGISDTYGAFFQIETTPMDLARAAFLLSHPSVPRHLGYSILTKMGADHSIPSIREGLGRVVKNAFPHVSDVITVPQLLGNDPMVTNPEAWIKAQVAAHALGELEDVA